MHQKPAENYKGEVPNGLCQLQRKERIKSLKEEKDAGRKERFHFLKATLHYVPILFNCFDAICFYSQFLQVVENKRLLEARLQMHVKSINTSGKSQSRTSFTECQIIRGPEA